MRVEAEAPGRVTLIGDHTDHDGGLALPFALPWRTRVSARSRQDGLIVATSSAQPEPVTVHPPGVPGEIAGWGAYVAGVVWALSQAGVDAPGADLAIESDVPVGAGLSSSHALQVAVAMALLALAGCEMDPDDLAELVQTAENAYVGVPSGLLDQLAIQAGSRDALVLVDAGAARGGRVAPVPCELDAAGLVVAVVDTGVSHALGDGGYAGIRRDVEAAAVALGSGSLREVGEQVGTEAALAQVRRLGLGEGVEGRARHVLTENDRVRQAVGACRSGSLRELGALLRASHVSMRDDLRNSDPVVDATVDALHEAGALGARMTGGGFGGSVVALIERDRASTMQQALERAYASMGRAAPTCRTVAPSHGASVRVVG